MSEEDYEDFHNDLCEFEDLIESKKHLINTPEMQKFYDRINHDIRWLRMELEDIFEQE